MIERIDNFTKAVKASICLIQTQIKKSTALKIKILRQGLIFSKKKTYHEYLNNDIFSRNIDIMSQDEKRIKDYFTGLKETKEILYNKN